MVNFGRPHSTRDMRCFLKICLIFWKKNSNEFKRRFSKFFKHNMNVDFFLYIYKVFWDKEAYKFQIWYTKSHKESEKQMIFWMICVKIHINRFLLKYFFDTSNSDKIMHLHTTKWIMKKNEYSLFFLFYEFFIHFCMRNQWSLNYSLASS